jgi:hypothetical protein
MSKGWRGISTPAFGRLNIVITLYLGRTCWEVSIRYDDAKLIMDYYVRK